MTVVKSIIVTFALFAAFFHMTASISAAQKNVYKATWASGLLSIIEMAFAYAIFAMSL